ncbi:MAG: peptidylprolyl isomerase [SAR86 cluster bacterium]|uniref:Peptidyl-prolyl cis-trans isomerase n=1 Tax=SAR86 cluster bacterium TaxID=2030880 RepID=A0A2A4MTT8_9GAMM|nr:MAG: peptidylprolyl isomerase [SAR86 cluster bacterium]
MSIVTNTVVAFHYRLAEEFANGERSDWREESFGHQPLYYLHGYHNVIVGLEKALAGKQVGDSINISLKPEDAYGPRNNNAMHRVPIKHLQLPEGSGKLRAGSLAAVKTEQGMRNVVVFKVGKFNADVDFNHPLAGKTLYYEIEVVEVRQASAEELEHGHVHGAGGHHH